MDEFMKIVLEVCVSVILIEIIIQMFPGKYKSIVQGTAFLMVSIALISGLIRVDWDLNFDTYLIETETSEYEIQHNAAEYGVALLKERVLEILLAAGIVPHGNADGISIQYRISDDEKIEIVSVQVQLQHETDRERAYALLQGIFTPIIPVEVYSE